MPNDMPEKVYMTDEQFADYKREMQRYHTTLEAFAKRQVEATLSMANKTVDADLTEKRDWFAGQALSGLLSGNPDADCGPNGYAHDAYLHADAMLAARKGAGDADA